MKRINIYTDGACSGNPGPGGYGVVLLLEAGKKELSGGFRKTTNNRMELIAVIEGLKYLAIPSQVELFSDSNYVVRAMQQGWVKRWKANGWMLQKSNPAKNVDLWSELLSLTKRHNVEFSWVKGHSTNPYNNRCDVLAVAASKIKDLPVDKFYEDFNAKISIDECNNLQEETLPMLNVLSEHCLIKSDDTQAVQLTLF